MIRQDITIDSTYLRNLSLRLGKEYLSNSDLSEEYNKIVSNLKEYHNLCVDRSEEGSESIWISRLKNLLRELNNYEQYENGQLLEALLRRDFINFFLEGENQKLLSVSIIKKNADSIDLDIAKNSVFKLLLNDVSKENNNIIAISPNEFYTEYNNPNSVLLRNPRNVDFETNDDMMELRFLWPYLCYAEVVEVQDSFVFKQQKNIELLLKMISYSLNPRTIVIKTNFDNKDALDNKLYKKLQDGLPEVEIIMKKYTRAHPRRILTEHSKIEITNTLDNIDLRDGKWVAIQPISFTCSLLRN